MPKDFLRTMSPNNACSFLPNRFKHSRWFQGQYNHHRRVWKNDGKLGPEQYTKRLGDAKNQGPHHCTPHVAQSTDGNDQKRFDNNIVIHAQGNAYGWRYQRTAQSGKKTAKYERKGKHPAYIDADGSTISLSTAAARAIFPTLVLLENSQSPMATMGPITSRNKLYFGKGELKIETEPWRNGGAIIDR